MLILSLLLSVANAGAQPSAPTEASPEIKAIYSRLLQEVQSGVQCAIREEILQRDLAKTRAELDGLKKDKGK
jgi:hypothetical protein